MTTADVHIIGGGLAGCEAAHIAARYGLQVALYEMRPHKMTAAHQSHALAELVCSNSFRSDDAVYNAVGLLHHEMRQIGSLVMHAADKHKLPAGSALAVDRHLFADEVTRAIENNPRIRLIRRHIDSPASLKTNAPIIIATGPLTSAPLLAWITETGHGTPPAFFDALAPILHRDSIDPTKTWKQSRYDKGDDYINCPLNKEQYYAFIEAVISGEKTEFKHWEKDTPYFEACLPIEVMAERGAETLRYGAMKPVGLTNPHASEKPYAVVQLRQDNKLGTLWNMVGFQTKLKHAEQTRIFRTIPGLENAEFARLGGIHRNSYICSPQWLASDLSLRTQNNILFAGQITGVEGYVESATCGILAALSIIARHYKRTFIAPPDTAAMGALHRHITQNAIAETFQPMNVNFGLFPALAESHKRTRGRDKKQALTQRAQKDFACWLQTLQDYNRAA